MRRKPNHQASQGSSSQESKLTTAEARWLNEVRPKCTAGIYEQDEKISREDAAEIYSAQIQILNRKGFQSLYSKKTKRAISQGLVLTDDDNLAILKNRLKNRVRDFFRKCHTRKAGYVRPVCECGNKGCKCESGEPGFSRIFEISDYRWSQIPDQRAEFEAERRDARDRLNELKSEVWEHLNPKDRAILDTAIRNPEGQFKRTPLYEAMTEQERKLFLPKDDTPVADEKEHIKRAIAARTEDVRRKIRRIIASDPGECDGCAA